MEQDADDVADRDNDDEEDEEGTVKILINLDRKFGVFWGFIFPGKGLLVPNALFLLLTAEGQDEYEQDGFIVDEVEEEEEEEEEEEKQDSDEERHRKRKKKKR